MSLHYSSAPCPHIGILLHTTDMRTVKCHTTRLIWNGKTLVVNEIFLFQISKFHFFSKNRFKFKILSPPIADSKSILLPWRKFIVQRQTVCPCIFRHQCHPSQNADVIWLFRSSSLAVYATPPFLKEPHPR